MFGSFKITLYLCICVFHSIRFKVNKGLELSGAPFFMPIPYLYIIKKIPPPLRSGRGKQKINFLHKPEKGINPFSQN